jgi:hypothetical protein
MRCLLWLRVEEGIVEDQQLLRLPLLIHSSLLAWQLVWRIAQSDNSLEQDK